MARRPQAEAIDWAAIERQYRMGVKSNLQLAAEYGVDASGIGKRAKKYGWVQDKREEVESTRESLLIQAASGISDPNSTPSPGQIKVAAQATADVILEHRAFLRRQRELNSKTMDKLEELADNMATIQEVIETLRQPNENGVDRANDMMRKRAELSELIDMAKKLAETDEKTRKGEREAFGIDKEAERTSAVEDLLAKIGAQA